MSESHVILPSQNFSLICSAIGYFFFLFIGTVNASTITIVTDMTFKIYIKKTLISGRKLTAISPIHAHVYTNNKGVLTTRKKKKSGFNWEEITF